MNETEFSTYCTKEKIKFYNKEILERCHTKRTHIHYDLIKKLYSKAIAQLHLKEVIKNHTHPKHKNETHKNINNSTYNPTSNSSLLMCQVHSLTVI